MQEIFSLFMKIKYYRHLPILAIAWAIVRAFCHSGVIVYVDWSFLPVIFSLVIYHASSNSWSVVMSIFSLISVIVFFKAPYLCGFSSISKMIIPHFPHSTLRNLLIGQSLTDCFSVREQLSIGHSIHCFFMLAILTKKYVLDIVSHVVYKDHIQ